MLVQLLLSDRLSIRRINNEEKSLLVEKLAFTGISLNDIVKINYVIAYKFSLSKGFDTESEIQDKDYTSEIKSIFVALITALRLYKDGEVGAYTFLQIVTLDQPIRIVNVSPGLYTLGLETGVGIIYSLNKTQLKEFKRFWNVYSNSLIKLLDFKTTKKDPFKSIKKALSRFNSAYGKRNPEDKIVDWMISYEALFSKKDDPPESISHRLALRSSRFSKIPSERKDLYIDLKAAYNVRSKIVHGDDWKSLNMDFHSHMRHSLTKYLNALNSEHNHDSILDSIDFD